MHLAGLLTLPSLTTPCALIGLISCVGPDAPGTPRLSPLLRFRGAAGLGTGSCRPPDPGQRSAISRHCRIGVRLDLGNGRGAAADLCLRAMPEITRRGARRTDRP